MITTVTALLTALAVLAALAALADLAALAALRHAGTHAPGARQISAGWPAERCRSPVSSIRVGSSRSSA